MFAYLEKTGGGLNYQGPIPKAQRNSKLAHSFGLGLRAQRSSEYQANTSSYKDMAKQLQGFTSVYKAIQGYFEIFFDRRNRRIEGQRGSFARNGLQKSAKVRLLEKNYFYGEGAAERCSAFRREAGPEAGVPIEAAAYQRCVASGFVFAICGRVFQANDMTQPLALVLYEKLLPGSQLVNRLQDAGYRVVTVHQSEELMACAEEQKPMIVLADLAPAHAKVPEVIGQLRQSAATSHIPVIAFADEKETELQDAARNAGATLVVNDAAILSHLQPFLEQALRVD
jgi:CheY-like chemotaxis protein